MDNNEFSFDALLESDEFTRYESKEGVWGDKGNYRVKCIVDEVID